MKNESTKTTTEIESVDASTNQSPAETTIRTGIRRRPILKQKPKVYQQTTACDSLDQTATTTINVASSMNVETETESENLSTNLTDVDPVLPTVNNASNELKSESENVNVSANHKHDETTEIASATNNAPVEVTSETETESDGVSSVPSTEVADKPKFVAKSWTQYKSTLSVPHHSKPRRSQSFLSHSRPAFHLSHFFPPSDQPTSLALQSTNEDVTTPSPRERITPRRMESFHYVGAGHTPSGLSKNAAYYRERYLQSRPTEQPPSATFSPSVTTNQPTRNNDISTNRLSWNSDTANQFSRNNDVSTNQLSRNNDTINSPQSRTYNSLSNNNSTNNSIVSQQSTYNNALTNSYPPQKSEYNSPNPRYGSAWVQRTPSFTGKNMEHTPRSRNYIHIPASQKSDSYKSPVSSSYTGRQSDVYSSSYLNNSNTFGLNSYQDDIKILSDKEKRKGRRSLPASHIPRDYESAPITPIASFNKTLSHYDPISREPISHDLVLHEESDEEPPDIPPPPKPEDLKKISEPIYSSVNRNPTRDYQNHEKYPSWPVTQSQTSNPVQPISTRANSYPDHTNTNNELPRKHKLAYEPYQPQLRPLTERSGIDDGKSRATSDPGLKSEINVTTSEPNADIFAFAQNGYPPPRYDSDGHNYGDKDYNVPSPPERDLQINENVTPLNLDDHISNLQRESDFLSGLQITLCDGTTSPMQSPSHFPFESKFNNNSPSKRLQETKRAYIVRPKPYYNTSTQTDDLITNTNFETKHAQCQVDDEQQRYKKPVKTFQEKSIQARMSIKSITSDSSDQSGQNDSRETSLTKDPLAARKSLDSSMILSNKSDNKLHVTRQNSAQVDHLMEYNTPMLRKLSEEMYRSHNKPHMYPERRLSTSSSISSDVFHGLNSPKGSSLTPAESFSSVVVHSDVSSYGPSEWGSVQTLTNDDSFFYTPKSDYKSDRVPESDPLAPAELRRIMKQGRYSLDATHAPTSKVLIKSANRSSPSSEHSSNRSLNLERQDRSYKDQSIPSQHSKQVSAPVFSSESYLHLGSNSSIPRSSESLTSVSSQNSFEKTYECAKNSMQDDPHEIPDSVFAMDPVQTSVSPASKIVNRHNVHTKSDSTGGMHRKQSMKKAYGIYDEVEKNFGGAISRSSKSWHNLRDVSKGRDPKLKYESNNIETQIANLQKLEESHNSSEKKWQQAVQKSKYAGKDNYANVMGNLQNDNRKDKIPDSPMFNTESTKVLAGNVRKPVSASERFKKAKSDDKSKTGKLNSEMNSKFDDVTNNLKQIEMSLAKYDTSSVKTPLGPTGSLSGNCIKQPEAAIPTTEDALRAFMNNKMKQTTAESPLSGVEDRPTCVMSMISAESPLFTSGKPHTTVNTSYNKTVNYDQITHDRDKFAENHVQSPITQSTVTVTYPDKTKARRSLSNLSSSSSGHSIPSNVKSSPQTVPAKRPDVIPLVEPEMPYLALDRVDTSPTASDRSDSPFSSAVNLKPSRRPPPPIPKMTDVDRPPKLPPRRSHIIAGNTVNSPAAASSPTDKHSTVGNLRSMFETSVTSSPRDDSYKAQLRKQAKRLSEQQTHMNQLNSPQAGFPTQYTGQSQPNPAQLNPDTTQHFKYNNQATSQSSHSPQQSQSNSQLSPSQLQSTQQNNAQTQPNSQPQSNQYNSQPLSQNTPQSDSQNTTNSLPNLSQLPPQAPSHHSPQSSLSHQLPSPLRMQVTHSRQQVNVSHSYAKPPTVPQEATSYNTQQPTPLNTQQQQQHTPNDPRRGSIPNIESQPRRDSLPIHTEKSALVDGRKTRNYSVTEITSHDRKNKIDNINNQKCAKTINTPVDLLKPIDISIPYSDNYQPKGGNTTDDFTNLPLPSPPDSFSVEVDNEDNFPISPSDLPPPPPELLTTFTEDDGMDDDVNGYPSESYGSYKNNQSGRQCGVYRRSSSADLSRVRSPEQQSEKRKYERRISEGGNVLQSTAQFVQEQSRLANDQTGIQDGGRPGIQDGGRSRLVNSDSASKDVIRNDLLEERLTGQDEVFHKARYIGSKSDGISITSQEQTRLNNGYVNDGLPPKRPVNLSKSVSSAHRKNDDSHAKMRTDDRVRTEDSQAKIWGKVSVFEAKRVSVTMESEEDAEESPRSVKDLRKSYENLARSTEDLSSISPRQQSINNVRENSPLSAKSPPSVSHNTDIEIVELSQTNCQSNVETGSQNSLLSESGASAVNSPIISHTNVVTTANNRDVSRNNTTNSNNTRVTNTSTSATTVSVTPVISSEAVPNNRHVHNQSPVSDSSSEPIVINHRRQKSSEELECEKQAKILASQLTDEDSKLSRVISPSPGNKETMDYMNGLYNNNTGENANDVSPNSRRNFKNERTSLPVNSPYWMSSGKAQMEATLRDDPNTLILPEVTNDHDKLVLKKGELVCSIEKKIEVLREEKLSLEQEIDENNALGEQISEAVEEKCREAEKSKFRSYTDDLDKIVKLLLKLSGLLARTENAINSLPKDADERQKKALHDKRKRLSDQHEEAKHLKTDIDKRRTQVVTILSNNLPEQVLQDFTLYVESKSKFIIEMQELDDKLALGEEQLSALKRSMEVEDS